MPELNVFFFGLICHIDSNEDGRPDFAAVLRNADEHEPYLIVNEQRRELASHISFSQVQHPQTDHSYKAWVPKLRQIVGGTLTLDRGKVWRFEYPKSDHRRAELSVVDTYDHDGVHKSKGSGKTKRSEQPVARIVRLRVPLDSREITMHYLDEDGNIVGAEPIHGDSCILLANAEARPDKGPNHFEHYSDIVAGDDTAVALKGKEREDKPPHSVPEHCSWVINHINSLGILAAGGIGPRASTRPECGNTNWP